MDPRAAVLALSLLAVAITPGCVVNDYLAQEGTVVVEIAASPANNAPNITRSNVDDFRELRLLIRSFSIKPNDGTLPQTFDGGVVVDLVKLDREGSTKLLEEKVRAKSYQRWGAVVEVQKAVLKNGTPVHVSVPASGFLNVEYGAQDAVKVPIAKTVSYQFTIAAVYNDADIPGPDGEYFLMSRPWESGLV